MVLRVALLVRAEDDALEVRLARRVLAREGASAEDADGVRSLTLPAEGHDAT